MPQTLAIGVLVLGGILLLIALLGGNFKLFGAEISESVSSKGLRWTAGILGFIFLLMALQGVNRKDDKDDKNIELSPKPSEASRNFMVGRWQVEQMSGSRSAGSVADDQADGTLTGSVTQFVNGIGQKQLVAGRWNFEKLSKDTFRLKVRFNNQSTWQGTFKGVGVTDCNRNRPGLQSPRFRDHIICIYDPCQDRIICN